MFCHPFLFFLTLLAYFPAFSECVCCGDSSFPMAVKVGGCRLIDGYNGNATLQLIKSGMIVQREKMSGGWHHHHHTHKGNLSESLLLNQFNKLFGKRMPDDEALSVSTNKAVYGFGDYHSYIEMLSWLDEIERFYPQLAKTFTIGTTYEGRPIRGIKIGSPVSDTNKRIVWIDGGMHAREWASIHTALWFIDQLISQYGVDPQITAYMDTLNFYVLPVANPDGFEYSRSDVNPQTRIWRKNRGQQVCKKDRWRREMCCGGVDLNRTFDFHWGETGSSSDMCADIYQGEPKSRAIRDKMMSAELYGKVDTFITLYTYSQMWNHPYKNERRSFTNDIEDLVVIDAVMQRAKELQPWRNPTTPTTTTTNTTAPISQRPPAAVVTPPMELMMSGVNFAQSGRLPDWRTEGRMRTAHHECAHAACHFALDSTDPVNYVFLASLDAEVRHGSKTGECGTELRLSYNRREFRQMAVCVTAGEIGEYIIYNDAMPSLPDRDKMHKMSMIYIYTFPKLEDRGKTKLKYYKKKSDKFLPKKAERLEELRQRALPICGEMQQEALQILNTEEMKRKLSNCANRLAASPNGLLSREDLISVFGDPASARDPRWKMQPTRTRPLNHNSGQLQVLEQCPWRQFEGGKNDEGSEMLAAISEAKISSDSKEEAGANSTGLVNGVEL